MTLHHSKAVGTCLLIREHKPTLSKYYRYEDHFRETRLWPKHYNFRKWLDRHHLRK